MSDTSVHLSIVIPAFNEEHRIGDTLDVFMAYLKRQEYTWEIVVVDDGSTDAMTSMLHQNYPDTAQVKVLSYAKNRGKGYAMRTGVQEASGRYILISDADSSTPIEEIEKFWPRFKVGADVVIGSRAMALSDVQVHQPWYRQTMGRMFNLLLRLLQLTRFKDTQCGFKGIRAVCVETIFSRMTIDGFGADCEMLFIAEKFGYNVEEIPVRWINSADTRVHPIFDSLDMFMEVMRIRMNAFLGKYR